MSNSEFHSCLCGSKAGGGMEPAAGELTVFFPRRDFRSILGFLSSIGGSSEYRISLREERKVS